jgi:lipopolysaccharide/colanic/teichoic acid biosynthesis glycosyltransferase
LTPAGEPHFGYFATKRLLDVAGGLVLLVVSLPFIAAAALAVAVTTGSWPFYVQRRVGYMGREFWMLKIRSMRRGADRDIPLDLNETDGPTFKSRTDPRVTRVGGFLRRTSMDELPQFVNVVAGQLSLVGPRPGLPSEVRQYTRSETRRLTVKPGLTAIWQVSGRSDVPFRRWMAMDRLYIRRRSLWLDLALLARTPWTVITMRGAR